MGSITSYHIEGTPPPWTATSVDKFIVGALGRVERESGNLPPGFHLSICPWGERNAVGGTPSEVREVTHPRFRLVHFTGCGRPYLVALFTGEDAARHQEAAMRLLPWSEHYTASIHQGQANLVYLNCTEDLWGDEEPDPRTLRELLEQGELEHF